MAKQLRQNQLGLTVIGSPLFVSLLWDSESAAA